MRPFTKFASILFTVMALAHLARLAAGWDLTVNDYVVPLWPSIVAIAIGLGLGYKLWKEAK